MFILISGLSMFEQQKFGFAPLCLADGWIAIPGAGEFVRLPGKHKHGHEDGTE